MLDSKDLTSMFEGGPCEGAFPSLCAAAQAETKQNKHFWLKVYTLKTHHVEGPGSRHLSRGPFEAASETACMRPTISCRN